MQQHTDEHFPAELSSQLVSIITTEHYNLQTGRSMTISEANGRASLFVGAVSSGLIALTFVGLLLAMFSLPLWVCTSAGVVAFLVSVVIHQRYQWVQWMRLERNLPILFPGQPGE
jgi:hypothetical protein